MRPVVNLGGGAMNGMCRAELDRGRRGDGERGRATVIQIG